MPGRISGTLRQVQCPQGASGAGIPHPAGGLLGGLPSCGGGLKSDHPAGGFGETNVKKRTECLDITVCNRLSLIESRIHLKCIEKAVKNTEPPQLIGIGENMAMKDIKVLIVILVLGIVPVLIYNGYWGNVLKKNGEYTNAVIYEFAKVKNGKSGYRAILRYRYIVDDVEYKGWGIWYPYSDTLSIGDSIIIMYDKKQPSFKKTKRDLELPVWER